MRGGGSGGGELAGRKGGAEWAGECVRGRARQRARKEQPGPGDDSEQRGAEQAGG